MGIAFRKNQDKGKYEVWDKECFNYAFCFMTYIIFIIFYTFFIQQIARQEKKCLQEIGTPVVLENMISIDII